MPSRICAQRVPAVQTKASGTKAIRRTLLGATPSAPSMRETFYGCTAPDSQTSPPTSDRGHHHHNPRTLTHEKEPASPTCRGSFVKGNRRPLLGRRFLRAWWGAAKWQSSGTKIRRNSGEGWRSVNPRFAHANYSSRK